MRMLKSTHNSFECKNFIDLEVDYDNLSKRVETELTKKVNQAAKVSNWESRPLHKFQNDYAASNAMALVDLYHSRLEKQE